MMRMAFHRGGGKWDVTADAIKAWTHGDYSHTELVFTSGWSYSARAEDMRVSFKMIDYKVHPERWDFLDLPYSDLVEYKILKHAEIHCGESYDLAGLILDKVMHTGFHKESAWWCSEICAHVIGARLDRDDLTPQELYDTIKKGAEI
jgi:hypothetical protein